MGAAFAGGWIDWGDWRASRPKHTIFIAFKLFVDEEGVVGGLGGLLVLEPKAPLVRRVDIFAAVFGAAGAHAEHQGCVDAGAADDDLAFAEGRQLFEHIAADAFD